MLLWLFNRKLSRPNRRGPASLVEYHLSNSKVRQEPIVELSEYLLPITVALIVHYPVTAGRLLSSTFLKKFFFLQLFVVHDRPWNQSRISFTCPKFEFFFSQTKTGGKVTN